MTIGDLRCDLCGRSLPAPEGAVASDRAAVRLMMHPGDARLRDDRSLVCLACWTGLAGELGEPERVDRCASCSEAVASDESLHLSRVVIEAGSWPTWQLCRRHAEDFLNRLRTTEPKIAPGALKLRRDFHTRST